MVIYEQPLNEKIRLFMRLEHMFERYDYYISEPSEINSQTARELLLELHEMSSRLDVKSAILKIIDHQTMVIKGYSGEDDELEEKKNSIIDILEEKTKELYSFHGQFGQHMKSHSFLNLVKQRLGISGGLNAFDAPLFNLWINQPSDMRTEQLDSWIKPYRKSHEAIKLVMDLIRKSAEKEECVAKDGFYQSTLRVGSQAKNYQLLRVYLPNSISYYPEISAGRQRFSMRFVEVDDLATRGKQVRDDVVFSISICGF
jgi:cell division protein ZapD